MCVYDGEASVQTSRKLFNLSSSRCKGDAVIDMDEAMICT